jgi:hypothetical protein
MTKIHSFEIDCEPVVLKPRKDDERLRQLATLLLDAEFKLRESLTPHERTLKKQPQIGENICLK